MLCCHACHLQGLPDLWLDRGQGHCPEVDRGLPLPELQGRVARDAGRGTDGGVSIP
jgi:hypothetical protein